MWKSRHRDHGRLEAIAALKPERYHRRPGRDKTDSEAAGGLNLTAKGGGAILSSLSWKQGLPSHAGGARRPRVDHEKDVPTEQPEAEADPWLPRADAHEGGPAGAETPPAEGAEAAFRLSGRLRPEQRLKTPGEFRRVFRSGQRLDGPLFQLVAAENGGSQHRLGLTVGRKVGGATARNRAKRLLRESFRRHAFAGGVCFDIVVVPKRELAERSQAEVDREYEDRLRRLVQSRRAPNRRPHPPPGR